ncbi:MAG TPA: murein biosynthesis integral membrane protein MurJ, partial [Methylomirabilota bacterium]|nr:murein biosynthesis integral membrane protein MurJ [Methylomirabilota bacterium]
FIPIFKQKEKAEGLEATWRATNAVISGLLIVTGGIVILGILIISVLLWTGAFQDAATVLMLRLLRVMLPYVMLVCFAAVAMGMLNARGHFFIPALSAALLNVAMIASVCLIAPRMGLTLPEQIFGLAIGVLIAGVAQAAFQLPLLRREGFRYRWVTPWKDETVRLVVRRILPAAIGVAAFQINVVVANGFAFAVGDGILSGFNYAVRLMELPQGVFGLSLATYLLPTLSGLAAEKKFPEFRTTLRDAVGYLLFINLLASLLLFILAEPMVRLLFEGRNFQPQDTPEVAAALMALAPGLIAFSFVNILGRSFYALGDTITPMKISVFCLVLNALLTLPLVLGFKQAGMGIANSATGFINVGLLTFALRKKLGRLEMAELRRHLFAFVLCAVAAAAVAWGGQYLWEQRLGHQTLWLQLGQVFAPMVAATAVYFGIAFAFRIPFAHEFLKLLRKRALGRVSSKQ